MFYGELYRIVHISGRCYHGIAFARDSTHATRFRKHLEGKGSVHIGRMLRRGESPESFQVQLLRNDFADLNELRQAEIDIIRATNSLWPHGLNGNCGNQIIATPAARAAGVAKRLAKIARGEINLRGKNLGKAVYRYPSGRTARLPTTHADVISGQAVHVNYRSNGMGRLAELARQAERARNGGITDKQVASRAFHRNRLLTEVIGSENWNLGNKKRLERYKRKEFTQRELNKFANHSNIAQTIWDSRDKSQRAQITQPGNAVRNQIHTCVHCGKQTNLGNTKRWHNDNCKNKPILE